MVRDTKRCQIKVHEIEKKRLNVILFKLCVLLNELFIFPILLLNVYLCE